MQIMLTGGMSEPKVLQQRLAMAFRENSASFGDEILDERYPGSDHFEARLPHSLEPDPDELFEDVDERQGMLKYWLAGGGLVASALVLSVGAGTQFMWVALCLGAIGAAAFLYSFAARVESRLDTKGKKASAASLPQPDPVNRSGESEDMAGAAMLGAIHDALGDITLSRSLSGVIISANNTFCRMVDCDRPEGRSCEELGIRFIAGPVPHCYDVEFGNRVYLWHDIVTRDPMLSDLVIQSIAREVTAERNDARQQEEARAKAEQESELKSRLIATVSHEIRTPLSGLLGMGHLLARTQLTAEQKNYLDGISQSGTALVQLVEDLLDFSTIAAGRFHLRQKRESIRPVIESVVELLSSKAHAKGIEIASTIDPKLPEALIFDPARFRQVLYNVVGNAVKFTEAGGVIVSAVLDGSALVVRVRDTGPGMNEAETQRIFGEFEQGDLSRAHEGGVGLGLAISARIIAETGGGLSVESQPGKGSTFTIRLPVAADLSPMRRGDELAEARVLLLAPAGPAATAVATTLRGLGAETVRATSVAEAETGLDRQPGFTGIIVDHRLDADFTSTLSRNPLLAGANRVFLVNPESRPAQMSGEDYDSWLIRPLREQSLIDVLTGRLRGLEQRPAASEEFPVISAEAIEEPAPAEPAATEPAATEQGLYVLVGEDDPVNAMISQAFLEKAGHRVRLADNFARLQEELSERSPDVLLTDYCMPDGTSEELIRRIRQSESEGGKPLPIIVLTADGSDDTRRKLLMHGADLVLTKPTAPEMITSAVTRLAERLVQAA